MDEMIYKIVQSEVKVIGERTLEITGSTEAQDRDGDVIRVSGWDLKHFRKNPVFLWAHDYGSPPIGRAVEVRKDVGAGKLTFKIEFADKETFPFADTIFRLFKGGFLHATSVGFIPKDADPVLDAEGNPTIGKLFKKQELLELSAVPVPSNPEALLAATSKGIITAAELVTITENKTVIPFKHFPLEPEDAEWDGPAEVREADVEALKDMATWYDAEHPDVKASYKLPHHRASNKHTVWRGVAAAGAAVQGARGGVAIPEKDLAAVRTHLGRHYREYDLTPPWETDSVDGVEIVDLARQDEPAAVDKPSQETVKDQIDYTRTLLAHGISDDTGQMALELAEDIIMRSPGGDIPVNILERVGAVLSRRNKGDLKEAQSLIQGVIDSAETETETDSAEEAPVDMDSLWRAALN
ncbi:hypothetical protein CMI37_30755 [Candidatus Pacearchaeota archaeon]|nr:hypothetical protein [Candidatus Pacearchaeota archaeon]